MPEVAAEAQPEAFVTQVSPLWWDGRGNIVAAVGVALLDLAKVRRCRPRSLAAPTLLHSFNACPGPTQPGS
ncbi:hypothetical protein ABIE45_001310 [Methylobacterium sp. OAE515]